MPFSLSNREASPQLISSEPVLEKTTFTVEDYARHVASKLPSAQPEPGKKLPVLQHSTTFETTLRRIHHFFSQAAQESDSISYAQEWLLDNFYLVLSTIRQIRQDLPTPYYHELPKLTAEPFTGYPRIYAAARAFATHTEGHVEQSSAAAFLVSFQKEVSLTMGELWAWPTMLRLCALENLIWALEHISNVHEFEPYLPVHLTNQLSQDYSAPQLMVASSITALRVLNMRDWQLFFEAVSRVEALLRRDPAGVYYSMDFKTRNQYRRVIEKLASASGLDEEAIAQAVLTVATEAAARNGPDGGPDAPFDEQPENHVGYYLIDRGYTRLLEVLGYRPVREQIQRWLKQHLLPQIYIGAVMLITVLITSGLIIYAQAAGGTLLQLITAGVAVVIPASAAAVHLVNWLLMLPTKPSHLPKLDFKEGIPDAYRTVVVIPALLTDEAIIDALVAQLELHHLRNPDPNLRFALLADYADAQDEHLPQDITLTELAKARIADLNKRYGTHEHQPFYFFLRHRLWNPAEGCWMGHERKRGKLAEFNRLLLDPQAETSYIVKYGDLAALAGTRYVITLDADTVMPHNTAQHLTGTLAHPLNRARFDADNQRLTAGYTVLQPRIELLPTVRNHTLFAHIMGGDTGFDLYTLAVSDVYQDLFDEGIYVGKGIYDVAAFERSVARRVPENALLSHDLFEGIHGRAGLATDIVLIEDYPTHYLAFTERLHRWIRGDWQLLPWLMPNVPLADGQYVSNPLSALSQWKILDNLRRSLERPTLLLLFLLGWLWLPGSSYVWTLVTLLILWFPLVFSVVRLVRTATFSQQLTYAYETRFAILLARWGLSIAFLQYESLITLDAITRTLYRLLRRRQLLEWRTAAAAMRIFGKQTRSAVLQQMLSGTVVTMAIAIAIILINPPALLPALPLLIIWILAPYLAQRLSQPHTFKQKEHLSPADNRQLRTLARRTWLYFEAFVGPADRWLPPDNYQREPYERVKHYTSPTNIGLMLLSTLGAYDMGYIGLLDLVLRLRFAFDSISQLERYRGHLLNWHHTQSLIALKPRYVSTVDSGNYAGCLLALQEGYRNLLDAPVLLHRRWQGLADILDVMAEILAGIEASDRSDASQRLADALNSMREQIAKRQDDPALWAEHLNALTGSSWPALAAALKALDTRLEERQTKALADLHIYLGQVHRHLFSMQRDIESLLPWMILLQRLPTGLQSLGPKWQALEHSFHEMPHLKDLRTLYQSMREALNTLETGLEADADAECAWCEEFAKALDASDKTVSDLLADFEAIREQIEQDFEGMDFSFLYDKDRHLFHIGYNIDNEQIDANHYDLLASEARLASYIAIAKGDVPYRHWLHLGRPMTRLVHGQALYSWSGTMFEYLMPLLLVEQEENTLLNSSSAVAVATQIAYARQHQTPWGISESGYYAFDVNENYQYRAFGVPALALKRGQELDHVVAPYASVLALGSHSTAVVENLRGLTQAGALGTYGLIEAIDYTTDHLPLGKERALVNEYMAHHQGIIFVALVNFLQQNIMVRRFHTDPRVESVKLLLLEQIPMDIGKQEAVVEENEPPRRPENLSMAPWEARLDSAAPQVHYLSNGQYEVMITSAGGGYSRWKGYALTRWRSDATLDDWGTWIYLRDRDSDALWSAGYQPVSSEPERLSAVFHPHKAEFIRRDYDLSSRLEIVIPTDSDLEIRRVTLTNHSDQVYRLTVCSYGEMVLAPEKTDQRHQAFNKMFIESEYLPEMQGLLFQRRPRSAHDQPLVVLHRVMLEHGTAKPQFETDRARFLGRNQSPDAPQALSAVPVVLSGTTGATLDPVMALAQDVEIEPYETVRLIYVTVAADERFKAITQARLYNSWTRIDQAFEQARYQAERELRQLGLDTTEVTNTQTLLSGLLYPHSKLRAPSSILAANTQAQSGLWAYGISGDYPIVLVEVGAEDELGLVYELIQAHKFWRNRGITSTLVILNLQDTSYAQTLYNQIHHLVSRSHSEVWINRHDGIFILRNEQLNDGDRALLRMAARVHLEGKSGLLAEQLALRSEQPVDLPTFVPTLVLADIHFPDDVTPRPTDLVFDNSYGGFSPDGQEYVIYVTPDHPTPAPWINVIANENAGFTLSESGGGFSWAYNSGENRLTAWRNDPVTDMPGEAMYLRDEETGIVWSPMPMPAGSGKPYCVRHGSGYTLFEHRSYGLEQITRAYMAPEDPVKLIRLSLKNMSDRPRRITITYYAEWVLGPNKDITQQYLIPAFDPESQTLTVRNPYSLEFGPCHAFITASKPFHGLTTDRTEFLGRMASYRSPAGLRRIGLTGTISPGLDPCAAMQLHVDLPVGGEEEVCFILGQGKDYAEALRLSQHYRQPEAIEAAWTRSRDEWRARLDSVAVRTPDRAMNILLPWLLYQALSCRIWGRSALYQSSGAYGYRDQLQDVMALVHSRPDLACQHILRAARHQFEAGDVLHWWHPPSGRGVRTRFADDLLWLPYVVAYYVTATGDESILQERVPFLKGEPLQAEEEERYGFYEPTAESFTLYEHCRRALDQGYTSGPHQLPLIKAGDWNDGMNRIGVRGRGESVWMAWFLYTTLTQFLPLCHVMGDAGSQSSYQLRLAELQKAVEQHGWDGAWYRRAYFDDGSPLGSAQNTECKIDSLVQSWAVLSGAADPGRAKQAMQSADEWLVDEANQVIKLFTPAFNRISQDPGYIKGYPPGIRENGGQYTHAALWFVWALAEMRQGHRAEQLFRLLNPAYHSDTADKAERYRVEPYVIAADVYGEPPHTGRGGWTWYTGSSGWMYRLGLEAILGIHREGASLRIDPNISRDWPHFEVDYRYGASQYTIRVENPNHAESGVKSVFLDDTEQPSNSIPLVDDGAEHHIRVVLG